MSKSKRQECFVNGHCCYDCPNFQIQTVEERYGAGIADGRVAISYKVSRYPKFSRG